MGSQDRGVKICHRCKVEKPLKDFSPNKRSKDGYQYTCRDCLRPRMQAGCRRYRQVNGERGRQAGRNSYKKNKPVRIAHIVQNNLERLKTDIEYKLVQKQRIRIYFALKTKRKSASTIELLGCSSTELKHHLEKQFKPGMTWENYGRDGWEVDHIRPCASFDLSNPEQQRQCFHYSNLQPLWKVDNIKKSDKWK